MFQCCTPPNGLTLRGAFHYFRITDADSLDDHRNTGNDGSPISEKNGQWTENVQQRSLVCGEISQTKPCTIMHFTHKTKAYENIF